MTSTQEGHSESKKQRQTRPEWLGRMHSWGPALLPPRAQQRVHRSHLVTKDLDLADGSVYQALSARATVVGVDLQVQGDALHPLLRGEVCAEAVYADEHLGTEEGAKQLTRLTRPAVP